MYKDRIQGRDLLEFLQKSFRYVDTNNNQVNTMDIEPAAVARLEWTFEHLHGIKPDLQKIVIGFEDILVLSRCFDYMVEVDFYNNNPLRYNGRLGKLFGLLEMRQHDAVNYRQKRHMEREGQILKRVEALTGTENAARGTAQRRSLLKWPLPASLGSEIADAQRMLAKYEEDKVEEEEDKAAPVPEEDESIYIRRSIAKMKNLTKSVTSTQNYEDCTQATEPTQPPFKLETKSLKKQLPEATPILAATKFIKPAK